MTPILWILTCGVALWSAGTGLYGLWTYQMAHGWTETTHYLISGIVWPLVWLFTIVLWSKRLH